MDERFSNSKTGTMKKVILIACILLQQLLLVAQQDAYTRHVWVRNGDSLPFRLLTPRNIDPQKKYPLIVVLHGSGERGRDNEWQLKHGSNLFLADSNRQSFPAFVLFPQCSQSSYWSNIERDTNTQNVYDRQKFISSATPTKALALVMALLDSMAKTPTINNKKIVVGGLSMGGMGTFELLWRKPNFFAAAFPICGGGDTLKAKNYAAGFPVWVFHGDNDLAVDVEHSREMVRALQKAKAKVKYSEYKAVGHDSWVRAFAEPDLMKWLLAQKRR
jgi:predicted peptidase